MRLYVTTRSNELVPVDVHPTDTVSKIQSIAFQSQTLQYNSIVLDANRTIESYNIQADSFLELITGPKDRFTLYVRVYGGRTFPLEATSMTTIGNMKQRIQPYGYPSSTQLLFHRGLLLSGDERPLASFNILGDALVDLGLTTTPSPTPPPPLPLSMLMPPSATSPTSTKANAPAAQQLPTITPTTQPTPTIPTIPTIPTTHTNSKSIYVQVQCVSKSINIAIRTSDQILTLKQKIHKHTNIQASCQSLTHNGKRLNDNQLIGFYQIMDGDSIDLLARPMRPNHKRKADTLSSSSTIVAASSKSSTSPTTSSSSSSTTKKDLLPVKKEGVKTTKTAIQPVESLYIWKFGDGGVIDLLSSDDEEEEKITTTTKQQPPPPQQQQQQPKQPQRKIKVRVEDGSISVLEMDHSAKSTLLDVIQLYQATHGQHNKNQSIIFGGVALENEFLLDDLFLDDESILNLV